MPLYDLKCPKCNSVLFDVHLYSGEEKTCPMCGGLMKKLPSNCNVHFKGAGWTPKFYPKGESK